MVFTRLFVKVPGLGDSEGTFRVKLSLVIICLISQR